MSKANFSLRLQTSLKTAAERAAAAERTSLNQFINVAVAEKLAALETESYFRSRAAKGRREGFLAFVDQAGNEPPADGDKLSD